MAAISSIGTGSGIDLEGLVGKILEAERAPAEQRLELKQAQTEASLSAYGTLKSTLSTYQATLEDLSDADSLETRSASSSNEEIFTATANNEAQTTSNSIQVLNLATAHKLASADFASPSEAVGGGTLTIGLGAKSFSLDITAGTNDSLTAIRDAINTSEANPGVTASLITVDNGLEDGGTVTKLVFGSAETGTDNQISITVDETPEAGVDDGGLGGGIIGGGGGDPGADPANKDNVGLSRLFFAADDPDNQATELAAAENARITVDGFVAVSSSNSFADVIDGITITAVGVTEDPETTPPETLSVSQNPAALQEKIDAFVVGYNELMITINTLTNYDPETGSAGLLNGDSGVRAIETLLRRSLSREIPNDNPHSNFTSLASIGLSTQRDGTISLDSEKFGAALEGNIDEIGALFSGENGIATELANVADGLLASDGVIKARSEGFDKQMRDIDDQRVALERRLTAIEARTRSQFAGLDSMIAQMQSTSSFLTEQLANLSSYTKK